MRITFACAVAAILFGAVAVSQDLPTGEFKALHLFNLSSPDAEKQLVAALDDLNKAIVQAGQPKSTYRAWKVAGKQEGNTTYLFESTWPSGAVYETVHNGPAYKAAFARMSAVAENLFKDHVYNRYVPLN